MPIKRPMLAPNTSCHEFLDELKFPVIASPKIDGMRCYKSGGKALTRSGKPQPNLYVRQLIENSLPNGVDGELTCGDFRTTTSELRTSWTEPNFHYHIFDHVRSSLQEPFQDRIQDLYQRFSWPDWVTILPQLAIYDLDSLLFLEQSFLELNYEGLMLRSPTSPYKCNRATIKEGYIFKLKRFVEAEAEIIGFYEQEENLNDAALTDLGTTHRSSHQANKHPKGTLGGLLVRDLDANQEFRVGTGIGWTSVWRQDIWDNQDKYIHRLITYKHLPHGNYDLPRNASMKGFRESFDLGEPHV